jgi:ABC-type amino acid transport substrate-binding protein
MSTRARAISLMLLVASVTATLSAGCQGDGSSDSDGEDLGTIRPGVITVAIRGDLPYAAMKDGELTGVDGDIMTSLAERLDQDIETETMDFSGQLGAVNSNRVDIAIGSIGWNAERADAGIFTDPTYYAGATVIEPVGGQLSTLESLEGMDIGTVTGYAWAPAIEEIPDAQLHTYETADAVYADVGSGRIDAAFVDALQDIYTAQTNEDLGIQTAPLQVTEADLAANDAYSVFGKVQLAFYLPRDRTELEEALSEEIRKMYESGELAEILQKWGVEKPADFLTPGPDSDERIGVDRPSDWAPPSAE